MNKIQELEEQIKKFSIQLEELKLSAKEEEFKVGDYAKIGEPALGDNLCNLYFEKDQIIKITGQDTNFSIGLGKWVWEEKGKEVSVSSLLKPTNAEIESHLISEAEKKGFVKGAKVKGKSYGNSPFEATIDKVTISFGTQYLFQLWHKNESEFWGIKDLSDAELIPSHPSITINGYKAEFEDWGLDFNNGCAKIDKTIFINLNNNLNGFIGKGNKTLSSVKIGNGEFTVKQIEEIANYYSK
jgi:hypothetical protein